MDRTIGATAGPILEIGRTWMMDPGTGAVAKELGLKGPFGFWVHGRAGFLGDVDADLAAAALGFMAPSEVRRYWENRPSATTPMALTEAYLNAAATWGRVAFSGVPESNLIRLANLSKKIIDAGLPATGALFAGWRGLSAPEDPAGRITVLLNVLREFRGGAHLSAVQAVGLGPHGSILSTDDPIRGGVPWAERFGWLPPHPEPDPGLRAEAERLTTIICRHSYRALTDQELDEFVSLVTTARAALDQ